LCIGARDETVMGEKRVLDAPAGGGQRPLTVGLLISWFGEGYSAPVVIGAAELLESRGINVVCFAGGTAPSGTEDPAGAIYKLVSRSCVDGLVIASGTLVPDIGAEGLTRFVSRYTDIPVVSLSLKVPGVTSVTVDSSQGLSNLLEHLIDVHHYRRIAFIRGPEASAEADERFGVCLDVLKRHGIAVDPALVAAGDFKEESGRAITARWLSEDRLPDAIVAANDEMAVGVLQLLHERGVRVPDDVAVVGFDDTDIAGSMLPSLTTVRQPLYDVGKRAAELVCSKLAGERVPDEVILRSSAVIRESCGCSARAALARPRSMPPPVPAKRSERDQLLDAVGGASDLPPEALGQWPARLVDAFQKDAAAGSSDRFLVELERILREAARGSGVIWPSQQVISVLRRRDDRRATDAMWNEARVLVGDAGQRMSAYQKAMSERRARALGFLTQRLINTTALPQVGAVFEEAIRESDFDSGFVCLFDDPAKPADGARLICRTDGSAHTCYEPGLAFAATELLPDAARTTKSSSMLVQPLAFGGLQRGFLALEGKLRAGTFAEELRQQLDSALLRIDREIELANLHAAERARALELEEAYRALKENQEKLLLAEKMAALGRLTAGIAHEMNTPLAAARAALEEISSLVDEYTAAIGDTTITPQDHAAIGNDMRKSVDLAKGSAAKVAEFVTRMKSQTRDIAKRQRFDFDAVPVVHDAMVLLDPTVRRAHCRITFEHEPASVPVFGSPESFTQVIVNLVTNAIEASVPKGGGPISVRLRSADDSTLLEVADQGTGIDPEIMGRIFDPLFTTKPFGEATGLGLTVVHDMVVRDLGGTVEVDSKVGEGTTFKLRFVRPLSEPSA
jgi:phosphoserine phosphatase RsbU/P